MNQRLFAPLFLLFLSSSNSSAFPRFCLHCCHQGDVKEQGPLAQTSLIPRELSSLPSYLNNPITLTTIRDAYHELENADSSTLAIFDIDDTILESDSPPFQSRFSTIADPENNFLNEFEFFWRRKKGLKWYTRFLQAERRQLVEPEIADYIHTLQKKGAIVLALSAFFAGASGEIADVHEFRHQELTRNGINLDKPLPLDILEFKRLCTELHKNRINLKRGIVSSAIYSKGVLINLIISSLQEPPKKILFFDDNPSKHKEVLAEDFQIPLASYFYTAAKIICPERHVLDKTVARAQLDYIYLDDGYVSYQEAAERVAKTTYKESTLPLTLNSSLRKTDEDNS